MNKLKVTLFVAAIVLILGTSLFFVGNAYSNSDWTNEVITEATSELTSAGHSKKNELANTDTSEMMKESLEQFIAEQEAELERLLEEYYYLKLQNLENTPEYENVKNKIIQIRDTVYNRYKLDIDSL
ncbi:hypothetical protein D7X33_41845, partial [Butyricicoccus sp. 1XD8-22]